MPERWNAGILKHGTPEYLNMERRNTLKKNARILKHGTVMKILTIGTQGPPPQKCSGQKIKVQNNGEI